ncbi:uncharacterized protein LOC129271069 [Lytechinus pictus]|uniref:uncharacterized protein LOC129271069 n=1 Tax=Lytechinus pictus TaxID=7653 RepID=UPI0030B9D2B8
MDQSNAADNCRLIRGYLSQRKILVILSVASIIIIYSIAGTWMQSKNEMSSSDPVATWYNNENDRGTIVSKSREAWGLYGFQDRRLENTRTLNQLMDDKSASLTFSLLANATQHRKGLPNYYIHGTSLGLGEDYSKCNIAFVHLHKAGGTTTKAVLRNVRNKAEMPAVKLNRTSTEVFAHYIKKGQTSKPTVFMGGFSFGICDVLKGRPCTYMAVLRNPYDRIISAYYFCYNSRYTLCGPVSSKDVSITTWAIHQGSHFFNQLLMLPDTCKRDSRSDEYVKRYQNHTRDIIPYIKKHEDACWFQQKALHKETLTKDQRHALLHYILENLENWFGVIGLLEEYQLSLELFGEAFKRNFTAAYSVRLNTGKARKKVDNTSIKQMKQDLLNSAEAREALYEDILIYEKAVDIMKRQKEEYFRIKNRRQMLGY